MLGALLYFFCLFCDSFLKAARMPALTCSVDSLSLELVGWILMITGSAHSLEVHPVTSGVRMPYIAFHYTHGRARS